VKKNFLKPSFSKRRSSSSKATSEPQTMDELLAQTKDSIKIFKVGDVVEGIVTEKTPKAIYLDIGGKTEGMAIDREMKAAADFIKDLKIGDKVLAVVTQPENDKGQTLLSFKKAAYQKTWDEFEEKLKTGQIIKVRGTQANKGGLLVEVKGFSGFIPASQLSSAWAGKAQELVGKQVEVKVIEVDRTKNRLVFSEKAVSEAGLLEEQGEALKKIKVGDILEAEISGVMPFGFFTKVIVGSKKKPITLEGLIHISEISWEKVEDPSKFYNPKDKVKVKVLGVDKKTGKLNLSIKQLLPDPWEDIEKKYPVDSKIKGTVVRLAPFGVFINLEPGIEGLVHISKIPAEKNFEVGEKVDCFVEFLEKENRRLSLGLVLKEKPVGYK
jgi:small subunit ribosomal protein S1